MTFFANKYNTNDFLSFSDDRFEHIDRSSYGLDDGRTSQTSRLQIRQEEVIGGHAVLIAYVFVNTDIDKWQVTFEMRRCANPPRKQQACWRKCQGAKRG